MAPTNSTFGTDPLLPHAQLWTSEHWTPNSTQRVTLIVAGCYVLAIAICMWRVVRSD